MRVLVAMSGGVDSSVAAALVAEELGRRPGGGGHPQAVGRHLGLGLLLGGRRRGRPAGGRSAGTGPSRLQLRRRVRGAGGRPLCPRPCRGTTPNPCIECNRHLKFDRLLERARALGFDAVATGHHARREHTRGRWFRLCRGADPAKDQSYVLAMLGQDQLARTLFPVGEMTKAEVRDEAARLGLRTAAKPDSQDVCFIRSDEGRQGFLGDRLALHAGRLVDHRHRRGPRRGGRRGAGDGGPAAGHGPRPRRAPAVRDRGRRARPAGLARLTRGRPRRPGRAPHGDLGRRARIGRGPNLHPVGAPSAIAQCSAHGRPVPCTVHPAEDGLSVTFTTPAAAHRTGPDRRSLRPGPPRRGHRLGHRR